MVNRCLKLFQANCIWTCYFLMKFLKITFFLVCYGISNLEWYGGASAKESNYEEQFEQAN